MTPEERERMNVLCLGIQEEKNYEKFAAMLREMSELIARKEERRFHEHPRLAWNRNRPSRTLPAVVTKTLTSTFMKAAPEKVEISIAHADELFREVRMENVLTNVDGRHVALKDGAQVEVTFEANVSDTIALESPAHHAATHESNPAA
jgi:chromatin segregation and condensation protein Rec8/ScpA/Scc1 (kleisin family)